jgi:hypothetical protein
MALLSHEDGMIARSPQDAAQAEAAGYVKCATHRDSRLGGQPCQFHISPEAQSSLQESGGYYTCPRCKQSHDFLHDMPWHGVTEDEISPEAMEQWAAGGGTRIGLGMEVQAEVGENLVRNLGEIPGYGPITWWHEGGALGNSPLDGATADWGIEVKTLGYDATHHRYIPGRAKEKAHKNEMANKMGKKGILGVLVMLDYRRSVADIYVAEHPLQFDEQGNIIGGAKTFRTSSPGAQHLVKEVPFKNPLLDPHDPSPHVSTPASEMPF